MGAMWPRVFRHWQMPYLRVGESKEVHPPGVVRVKLGAQNLDCGEGREWGDKVPFFERVHGAEPGEHFGMGDLAELLGSLQGEVSGPKGADLPGKTLAWLHAWSVLE